MAEVSVAVQTTKQQLLSQQTISAAYTSGGDAVTHGAATSQVTLKNVQGSNWRDDMEYRVGSGEWVALPIRTVESLDIDLAAQTLRVRKASQFAPATLTLDVEIMTAPAGLFAASDQLGGLSAAQVGILVVNNGQFIGRSLVAGPGVEILYPTGIGGDPLIYTPPGRTLLGTLLGANLAVDTDQMITIREYPQYIPTDIIFTNASVTPVAAAGGVYSTTGKGGYVLVASSQVYTELTDPSIALHLTMGTKRRLTGPALYFSLTTPNGAPCTADAYVFGDWLMG